MHLTPEIERRLRELLAVFLAENDRLNLSALRTPERCWTGNILDSLAFLDAIPQLCQPATSNQKPVTILDVGTGGGFPLLPVAVCLQGADFTGFDAIAKKVRAVERMAHALHLANVRTVAGRVEEAGHSPLHRAQYDIVLSRAVATLPVLLEYTAAFARENGHIVLWKSMHIEEELALGTQAQKILRCTFERSHRYALPDPFGERQLLIFRKTGATPEAYPRPVGVAKRKPI